MRTINFTEARSNLKEVLDTVTSDHSPTIITRRGSEDAVVMSASDYSSLQETLYLFGNSANATRLQAAMAEADVSLPAGARILGPEGFVSSKMGTPKVIIKKVAKKPPAPRALIKGESFRGADVRQNVPFVPSKAPAGRPLTKAAKPRKGGTMSVAKAASRTHRKA